MYAFACIVQAEHAKKSIQDHVHPDRSESTAGMMEILGRYYWDTVMVCEVVCVPPRVCDETGMPSTLGCECAVKAKLSRPSIRTSIDQCAPRRNHPSVCVLAVRCGVTLARTFERLTPPGEGRRAVDVRLRQSCRPGRQQQQHAPRCGPHSAR